MQIFDIQESQLTSALEGMTSILKELADVGLLYGASRSRGRGRGSRRPGHWFRRVTARLGSDQLSSAALRFSTLQIRIPRR